MGKAERKANRASRKVQKKRLIAAIENAIKNKTITFKPSGTGTDPSFAEVFNQVWPILDPALKFAMTYTKPDTDKVLEDVWDAGNAVATGGENADTSAFQAKFDEIWDKLSTYLELVQTFTNDKVDAVIDQVLEIGDWIAND